MIIWLCYDIASNRVRKKVHDACKDSGLYSIQKSVFAGDIEKFKLKQLEKKIEEMQYEVGDSILIIPSDKGQIDKIISIGALLDKKLLLKEYTTMFY